MNRKPTSLSQAYPSGASYFYGYPVGTDSGFLNHCPPADEELVAMRAGVCAGSDTRVVVFASTISDRVWNLLKHDLGVPYADKDQFIVLPSSIDASVLGQERNQQVKVALASHVPQKSLVMAQPYLDPALANTYLLDPDMCVGLNDKKNYDEYFPVEHRIPEYARCVGGGEFAALSAESFPYPCVVKVSSSGSGDGVRLCKGSVEFRAAQQQFKDCDGIIMVQKMIDIARETEIKFAVPQDASAQPQLIGYSDEVTGTNGEYLGGVMVNETETDPVVQKIFAALQQKVLPAVREKGWFGVGGIGVLIDKDGEFYLCDPNFRMTAMMPQVMEMNAGKFGKRSVLGFGGSFPGTLEDFQKNLGSRARMGDANQKLNIVSMLEGEAGVQLHGGVLFDQKETLGEAIAELRCLGLQSDTFEALHHVCLQKYLQ